MNSKPQDPSNAKLTDRLRALLIGGALAIAAAQTSSAAQVQPKTTESLDTRIQKLRDQVHENPNTDIRTGNGSAANGADLLWWRNAWCNAGWHNWRYGWRNGGGWGNWHDW